MSRSCVNCFHVGAVGGYKPECMLRCEPVDLIATYGGEWEEHICDNWEYYDEDEEYEDELWEI